MMKDENKDELMIGNKSPEKGRMVAMKKNFSNVKHSSDPSSQKNWAESLTREVDVKASRHHDLIQDKKLKEDIQKRQEVKKAKHTREDKMPKHSVTNQIDKSKDIESNIESLKKIKKKKTQETNSEPLIDEEDIVEDNFTQRSNLKEMIDKLNDLKTKTTDWQKTNNEIIDWNDSYLRQKRLQPVKSKERTESLSKNRTKDGHNRSQTDLNKSGKREKESRSVERVNDPDLQPQVDDVPQPKEQLLKFNDEKEVSSGALKNERDAFNLQEEKKRMQNLFKKNQAQKSLLNKSNTNKSVNKKLESSLNNNISDLNQDNLYEQNLIAKSFSSKQLETIKKVLGDGKIKKTPKDQQATAVNTEYERSLAKEIRDLRTAIKILETQKSQILKDSDEINKCIGYLSSNPDITESLLLSQMEQNRPAQCEMLNKQVNEILSSSQIMTLREGIVNMTKEVEMYESLLASFIQSFDPDKIAEYNELIQKCAELENLIKLEENTPIISSQLKNYDSKVKQNVFKKVIKIEILSKAVDKFESEIDGQKKKASEVEDSIKVYSGMIAEKNKEVEDLMKHKNGLMEKIDELKAGVKLKNILAEIEQLHEKIKEYNQAITKLQAEKDEKQKSYDQHRDTNEHYAETLKNMNDDFLERKENQTKTIVLQEEKINTYKNKFERLNLDQKNKCIELQGTINELNNQICKEKEHKSVQTNHDRQHVDVMMQKFKKHFEMTDQQIYKEIKDMKFKDTGEIKSAFIFTFRLETILKGWDGKELEWQLAHQILTFKGQELHPASLSTVSVSKTDMDFMFKSLSIFSFCREFQGQIWDHKAGLRSQLFKKKEALTLDRLIHKLLKFLDLENKPLYWTQENEVKIMDKLMNDLGSNQVVELQSKIKGTTDSCNEFLKRKHWETITEQQDCRLSMKECEYLDIRAQQYSKQQLKESMKSCQENFQYNFMVDKEHLQKQKEWKPILTGKQQLTTNTAKVSNEQDDEDFN